MFQGFPRFSPRFPYFPGDPVRPGAGGPFLGCRRLSAAGGPTGGRERVDRVDSARGGGDFGS